MCERCVRLEGLFLDCQVLLDPGQAVFILLMSCHTEKIKQPEWPSGHCWLIPPAHTHTRAHTVYCTNSSKSWKEFPCSANWLHYSKSSFFKKVYESGEITRPCLAQLLCQLNSRAANSGPVVFIGPEIEANDLLPHPVFSPTLRRWVEGNSTLVSSSWTSKSAVERSEMRCSLHPPPRVSLTSLKFSAVSPVGQVDPPHHWNSFGGINV